MTATSQLWTVYDELGYVRQRGVEMQSYDDGTTRIGGTLHITAELTITDDRIESHNAGWYLTRQS